MTDRNHSCALSRETWRAVAGKERGRGGEGRGGEGRGGEGGEGRGGRGGEGRGGEGEGGRGFQLHCLSAKRQAPTKN